MLEGLIGVIVQVSATLLLGAFFGLERRMRGYPDASELHAFIAALGLIAMLQFRPAAAPMVAVMAVAMAFCFALIGGARAALRAIAGQRDLHAASGADVFTLGGAMSAGCACGSGDVRAVAGVMLIMTLFSMFRPLENYAGPALERGDVDAPHTPHLFVPPAANDDAPPRAKVDAGGDLLGR